MKRKRSTTVEPVFGTLTQFMGLRKINTLGVKQANKVMQMAAIAYNIKKYLKFITKMTNTQVAEKSTSVLVENSLVRLKYEVCKLFWEDTPVVQN
jgi:hypothetical protein